MAVEGQSVRGSPFSWEINRNPRQESRNQGTGMMSIIKMAIAGKQEFVFSRGKHSWKLQLVSLSLQERIQLEIGCRSRPDDHNVGYERSKSVDCKKSKSRKWCWYYDCNLATSKSRRSDRQTSFITSVQDNDVFRVFLNFETKKLTIYNVRNKQAELFTGVEGEQLHAVISPSSPKVDYHNDIVECETHLSLVVDKPTIL